MKNELASALVALLFGVICSTGVAQSTEKEWRAKAVEKYPSLGVPGSELNKRFLKEYNALRSSNPQLFTNPQWPMFIADDLAAHPPSEAVEPATPPPESTPHPSEDAVDPASSTALTPEPATQQVASDDPDPVLVTFIAIAMFSFIGLMIWLVIRASSNSPRTLGSPVLAQEIICPHCHTRGCVTTQRVSLTSGVSGGKATAALLTGGFSLLFVGLSQKEYATQAACSHCGSTWRF